MISKSRDNLTALSCVRRLRVELLETEKKDLDLVEILDGPDGFESRLHDRRNILAEAEAQPNATAETITAALLDELRKIRASGQSAPLPSNADGAPAPLDESRLVAVPTGSDNAVFHTGSDDAVFRTITTALSGLDLGTPSGQRDALTIGYNGKCVATVRVLFSTSESGDLTLVRRHATLSQLNELRQYRAAYFTWHLRVSEDMAVSDRMERYSVASMLNGGDRSVLDGWLRLDLDTTDFIAAPHGVMGRLQHQDGQSLPVVHDPMDYFCQPTLITKFCEFMHILACASGLAATSSDGYTFVTLGDWYNSHLERAHRCPDITAVRVWLERSVRGFKSALMAIKMRLRAILYSPTVERPFDTFVLSFDAECFSELRSAEVTQESLADRLAEGEQYLGSTSSAPALRSTTLPLLSSLVKPPAKPKGPATKRQELADGTSPTPATPAAKAPSKPKGPMTKRPKLGETTAPATSVTELTHSSTATIDESGERLMGMAASDAGSTTPLSSAAVPPAPDPSTLPYCNCHRRCFNRIWPQDRSPLCDFCYDGCDDCECAGEALGPQGQPCCVRPLEAATVCGECTGEVTPVTRTLGQMAVAVQAPAVEPVMMVIESSPFPEPVADAPGAHPPAVVPPEPVPLEAPLFEEHLIFHEPLDMPANVGPRLADALAPSLRGKLESAVVTLMVAGVGGDVPDLLDIKSASVRRARASLRKHSVIVDEWEAPKIKAAAWLAQYVAPPHDSTSVRHMADNPLRRHAFGLLRHHMLVLADARDAHDSFGNYEMFISGISDVAEIFEDIVLGARVVYDDNGADGDDADHSGVMLEPFVPASLAVLVPLRPSEDTVAGLALDPTPTEPTAEPTPPAPSLPASPPASETDNDEEVEDIEEVEVELEFEEENLVLEVVVDAWAPCTPTSPPAPGLSTAASGTAVASPSASSPRSAGGTLGERACASLDWAGSGPAPRGLEVIYLAAGTSRLITARDPELGGGDWGGTYNVHVSPPKAETGWGSDYEVRITSERRHPRGQDEPTLLISWLSAWGRPLSSKLPAITTIEASARNTFGVETQRLSHGEIIAYGTPNGYWSGSTLLTPHLATTRLYWAFRLNVRSEPPLVPGPPGWPRRPPQSTPGNSEPGRRRQSSQPPLRREQLHRRAGRMGAAIHREPVARRRDHCGQRRVGGGSGIRGRGDGGGDGAQTQTRHPRPPRRALAAGRAVAHSTGSSASAPTAPSSRSSLRPTSRQTTTVTFPTCNRELLSLRLQLDPTS